MKLLVISAAFPPMRAPEADYTLHFCQRLADRGLDVQVLTTRGHAASSSFSFQVHPLMRKWSWREVPRFVRFLRHSSPDAILLMYIGWIYNDHPMISFAPTISRRFLPEIPFVTQFTNAMGTRPDRCSLFTRSVRKAFKTWASPKDVDYDFGTLLRDSNHIIVLSDNHRATLEKHFRRVASKSVLIPPPPIMRICPENAGASRHRGRQLLDVKPNDFLLVYFGYIYPPKGLETLLRSFHIVSVQRTNIRLALVGGIVAHHHPDRPRYAQELYELSKQLGVDDKLRWTGQYQWDSEEASLYLHAADACVLPFDTGVQLNNSSFAAAAAHGLPIITTQGRMLEQPFVHQGNVFLCPPKSPEAIAAAIKALMDKPDLRQRLRMGALRLSQEWFSWDSATDRTIATLSTAV